MAKRRRFDNVFDFLNNFNNNDEGNESSPDNSIENITDSDDENVENASQSPSLSEDSEMEEFVEPLPLMQRIQSHYAPEKFPSKNGVEWRKCDPTISNVGRISRLNIIKRRPGPTSYSTARISADSPISAWRLLFDETMLRSIKRCTDKKASADIPLAEYEQFIGLVYARGLLTNSNISLHELWSEQWKSHIFPATMTRDKFCNILRHLRFDDRSTRSQRLVLDKFALASDLWYPFIENCKRCYNPSQHLTIDEQLLPCKCRCSFIQYMSNKPDKFGIKFFHLVDNDTKYLYNGFPYLGKDDRRPQNEPLSLFVVKKLAEPIENGGYNITGDNFFSSMAVVKHLASKSVSYNGIMRSNSRDLPNITDLMATSSFHESTFLSTANGSISLTCYKATKKKVIPLITSFILQPSIPSHCNPKKKPDTILLYNKCKCGVDIMDNMTRMYTTRRTCRRWPMYIFYNVLDISAINAWVIYNATLGTNMSRKQFMFLLVQELTKKTTPVITPIQNSLSVPKKRHRCQTSACRNNTYTKCFQCAKYCCGKCTSQTIVNTICEACKT
jgi:hypothetical protein